MNFKLKAMAASLVAATAALTAMAQPTLTINGTTIENPDNPNNAFTSLNIDIASNGSITIQTTPNTAIIGGETDSDGDGTPDDDDDFPFDPNEQNDADGDGVGDNADEFPNDPTETVDTDGDGVGDNADAFPNDPTQTVVDAGTSCVNTNQIECGGDISLLTAVNTFSLPLPPANVPAGTYAQGTGTQQFSKTLRRRFTTPGSTTYAGRLSYQVSTGTIMDYSIVLAGGTAQQPGAIDPSGDVQCSGSVTFVQSITLTTRNTTGLCELSPNRVYFLDLELSNSVIAPSGSVTLSSPLVVNGSVGEQLSILSQ